MQLNAIYLESSSKVNHLLRRVKVFVSTARFPHYTALASPLQRKQSTMAMFDWVLWLMIRFWSDKARRIQLENWVSIIRPSYLVVVCTHHVVCTHENKHGITWGHGVLKSLVLFVLAQNCQPKISSKKKNCLFRIDLPGLGVLHKQIFKNNFGSKYTSLESLWRYFCLRISCYWYFLSRQTSGYIL